jgi:hypothetical protein
MNYLALLLSSSLFAFATVSSAQEPKGHIDLDVVSNSPLPTFVVVRVSFAEGGSLCPEDRETLRISGGKLTFIRSSPTDPRPKSDWRATMQPTDDETLRYRIETPNCRMDIAVREQVRRDGSWAPLLVPRQNRPSVPPEERRELQRQFLENLRTPKESTPSGKDWFDRWTAANKEMRAWRSFGAGGTAIWPFAFEAKPQTCFEAMGDSHIESSGIRFSFLTALPGDLNRFVIERADLDADRSRLYFMRGDCRFELTVSQSVLRDGEWISVPLAPIPPPKG